MEAAMQEKNLRCKQTNPPRSYFLHRLLLPLSRPCFVRTSMGFRSWGRSWSHTHNKDIYNLCWPFMCTFGMLCFIFMILDKSNFDTKVVNKCYTLHEKNKKGNFLHVVNFKNTKTVNFHICWKMKPETIISQVLKYTCIYIVKKNVLDSRVPSVDIY